MPTTFLEASRENYSAARLTTHGKLIELGRDLADEKCGFANLTPILPSQEPKRSSTYPIWQGADLQLLPLGLTDETKDGERELRDS